jgi:hypothetical protein
MLSPFQSPDAHGRWLTASSLAGWLLVVLSIGIGCNRQARRPVYPVRGKVLVANRPAAGAFVVFHPVDDEMLAALRPYGHGNDDGSFELTAYEPHDGAPNGEYSVSVVWLQSAAPNTDPPDRLNGRYRDPKTTTLRATVPQAPTELAPFELSP